MEGKGEEENWSEKVEDLVDSGEIHTAISHLETLISHLETINSPNSKSQLSSALFELSKLYSSINLSVKSDQLSSRALSLQLGSTSAVACSVKNDNEGGSRVSDGGSSSIEDKETIHDGGGVSVSKLLDHNVATQESSEDDWEAMVDRAPEELISLSSEILPKPKPEAELSKLSLSDTTKSKGPIRRGRGTFTYRKKGLYSDEQVDDCGGSDSSDEAVKPEIVSESRKLYGTHHVIVLDGFNPSTTTADLEKLFKDFRERGFSIQWVNDTLALAVFQTPSIAREALDRVRCPFSTRLLEADDSLLSSVSMKDLDPPRQRPKTSARTAQRLIAQELGLKLPSNFGSKELRKQEEARKNRIVARQNLRDEAWGGDDTK